MTRLCLLALTLLACGDDERDSGTVSYALASPPDSVQLSSAARDLVLRARAFDRANQLDSARAAYAGAAGQIKPVADWLYLRAAGATRERGDREDYYDKLETPLAKERAPFTEALALERMGDLAGAMRIYDSLGQGLSYLRLHLARPNDVARVQTARSGLIAFLRSNASRDHKRDAVLLFDKFFTSRTPAEELAIARAAASLGSSARAASGFARAFRQGLGTPADRFSYGTILARLNRDREAAAEYARVSGSGPLAAAAAYQRARALLALGQRDQARGVLRQISSSWSTDTSAASALLLLADLAADDGRDAAARDALLEAARRFPGSPQAATGLFRAGLIAFVQRNYRVAAAEFDSLVSLYPRSDEVLGAMYWSGRSWAGLGDSSAANTRWRNLMTREGGSYYTVMSARRLGVPLMANPRLDVSYPAVPEVTDALVRIRLLKQVGMDTEMRLEQDRVYADAPKTHDRLLATAHALAGTEQAARSILLGRRAVETIGPSVLTYRLVYPVVERAAIAEHSRANGLDPLLVAGLIKQESSFNPRATSAVGARGLMQLMPTVGRALARSRGIANYSDDRLYEPALNIRLGTAHLAGLFRRQPDVVRVLAGYNAGEARLPRWNRKAGASDPEVFTERISFLETREYVKAVLRNRAFYGVLYSW